MIPRLNDGTTRQPYLRTDLNEGTLTDLPDFSIFPQATGEARYAAIKEAGFAGVQGGDANTCRRLGLGISTGGRINAVGEIDPLAAQWKSQGYECATLHVAWGFENDDVVNAL